MRRHTILAVVRKELAGYFSNPTAYVFITLFVFLSGVAAFWNDRFFARNLANLDTLNGWFPALLLFLIPAITMSAWADERKQGTDELLLTLPAGENDLLLGKFAGCGAIYAICLAFAGFHAVVLAFLGKPDIGVMAATYLGYLLAGLALCGVGVAASTLSSSPTVSFIASAVACGVLVGLGLLADLLGPGAAWMRAIALPTHMESFGRGVVDLADVAYFAAVAATGVWFAVQVVRSRRRGGWSGGWHTPIRLAAILLAAAGALTFLSRAGARVDATAERLWSIDTTTRKIIGEIPSERPVAITAYVSNRVPGDLVQQRETLLGLLREIESIGGGRVQVRIVSPEPGSESAREADRAYGIKPRVVPSDEAGAGGTTEVFLGLAIVGGAGNDPAVVPFLSRGLSAEYELARSIRAAGAAKRKKVGILDTQAGLFGAFDFQTMSPGRDWPIVTELRKQYEVQRVTAAADMPADLDVLLIAQPSTLTDPQLASVVSHIKAGRATLIFEDPFPLVNPQIATSEPRQRPNPMMGAMQQDPKANLAPLWESLGASVPGDAVVWDTFNPHPQLAETPNEFIWVARRPGDLSQPFNESEPITGGLQECVVLFAGRIERLERSGDAAMKSPEFVPLLRSSPSSGRVAYADVMQRNMFGGGALNPNRRPTRVGQSQTLAAHIRGGENRVNCVVVGDLDLISETFFSIRESGFSGMEFDNVTFVLNAVDALAGDQSLLDLRKKRRAFRTLEALESRRQEELQVTKDAELAARAEAETRLREAQDRLDAKVREVEGRKDLDDTTRRILLESTRAAEQRRLNVQQAAIEDQQRRQIEDAKLRTRQEIERIQMTIRVAAVALPPIPALATGLIVFIRRRALDASGRRAPVKESGA